MRLSSFHLTKNSIAFKLIICILVVLIPLSGLLIYNNYQAMQVVRQEVAETNREFVSVYMEHIDSRLDNLEFTLKSLMAQDEDLTIMMDETSGDQYQMAKSRLSQTLEKENDPNLLTDMLFAYSIPNQEFIEVFDSEKTSYQERQQVRDYISALKPKGSGINELFPKQWAVRQIGGQYYLLYILESGDMLLGTWIKADNLLKQFNLVILGENGKSLFATTSGEPMHKFSWLNGNGVDLSRKPGSFYLSGNPVKYLVVGSPSSNGAFSLIALIPDSQIRENLPNVGRLSAFIMISFLIALSVVLLLLQKVVLAPLNHILKAMKRIREGDMKARIDSFDTSDEFLVVNETFNSMITQIQELRISVYEEQLSKQQIELQRLQLQVNPHFLMNTLNIIYNLSHLKDYKLIQEFTLCLVQYFRFMLRSNQAFVPLNDELHHVKNYIRIQELRFPGSFSWEIEIPDFALHVPVPPILIQTFVENTFKYAISSDKPIHLSISSQFVYFEHVPWLQITVQDNGIGFPGNVLQAIREGKPVIDEMGEHIGIWNAQRRVELLYNGQASLLFENKDPSGAVVTITIPILDHNHLRGE
ncbi:sensor histidine kinase [Paenibacillus durus]|uniref:HAMP domain-containing protein n=1 Tax=Paenibacillus durus ATCC 35681 TaxID=1333534 RepID=A0A0F7F921_PAEDU|nr:histidine kinase [Paenibacillus durus]AKG34352.1 hypothetical protein VK70_07005 [Paenibacillus durus ATCC 35681]